MRIKLQHCLVCLQCQDNNSLRIYTTSSQWSLKDMQAIIEKHLWWWHRSSHQANESSEEWICQQCWRHLETFNRFYEKVEQQHCLQFEVLFNDFIAETNNYENKKKKNALKQNEILVNQLKIKSQQLELKLQEAAEKTNGEQEHFSATGKQNEVELKDRSMNDLPVAMAATFVDKGNEKESKQNEVELQDQPLTIKVKEKEDYTESKKVETTQEQDQKITELQSTAEATAPNETKPLNQQQQQSIQLSKRKYNKIIKRKTPSVDQLQKYEDLLKSSGYEINCSICSSKQENFSNLKFHFRLEHKERGYALCCQKKYYTCSLLLDHLKLHDNPEHFKCTKCSKTLQTQAILDSHLQWHETLAVRKRSHQCQICCKAFFTQVYLETHKLSHRNRDEQPFHCSQCDKRFATKHLYRQHQKAVHPSPTSARICDLCGKIIRNRYLLKRHMAEHGADTKVTCELCGAQLKHKYLLNRHMIYKHKEENLQSQKCPHCEKVLNTKIALRVHIKAVHQLIAKHACHLCSKAFKYPKKLREHISTHTRQPLYTCSYCPKDFISNSEMYRHCKRQHPKEWEAKRLEKQAIHTKVNGKDMIGAKKLND